MLLELNISNFALIDRLTISFEKGLNILTGETGAGKSIIIDAVNLVLGERADRDSIRTGADRALVEAHFDCSGISGIEEILDQMGIELEDGGILVLSREIKSGRSICRVNGRAVSLSYIKEISRHLIDIHGQHQHQSLLDVHRHMDILDHFGGEEVLRQRNKVELLFRELASLRKLLDDMVKNEMERQRNIDLYDYQINEISAANLQVGEDEELEKKREVMANAERIYQALAAGYQILYQGDGNSLTVIDGLNQASALLSPFVHMDQAISEFYNNISSSCLLLQEISRDMRSYLENIEFDQGELNRIEERLDLINKLKRKYGNTIEEILSYRDKKAEELERLINSEEELKGLEDKLKDLEARMEQECEYLSGLRDRASVLLGESILKRLKRLGMEKARFMVKKEKMKEYTPKGRDYVEFMFSANPGEPLKPLHKIASGGEMSRIMLAIKTSLAHIDNIPTLIFDEIDVGISGRTATVVAQQLAQLSSGHQVICVTHLPQIASMADTHYLIKKIEKKGKTYTTLESLDEDARIQEIARLAGGESISEAAYRHARELIDVAQKYKDSLC